ncbi:trypsin-like peptidase domain-containing protein [Chondromyces apiculatus]|uniref:HtrA protease/chaperone protein n=1 Tax=Chondromyces apiculatus DSM 436 TaxID=1192034 RepID=A0A017TBQ9_9BACT|nr:trypsin-like peptidase domain-containing protein [Chondromyces apiculatus]EYF06723.1 HtrA protease/chaperone protein [Chondromyces apiculatus DSM 436]
MTARRPVTSLALLLPLALAGLAHAQPAPGRPVPAPSAAPSPAAPPPIATSAPGSRGAAAASGSIQDLRRLGDAFADVVDKVAPSVVQIEVAVGDGDTSPLRLFRGGGERRGVGSGVIYSADGAILTNNHVIDGARAITVRLRDGRTFYARLVGRDPSTDLALLRIDARNLPAAPLADSDTARVGSWVVAIGSPFGLGYTVTTGVLSAKGRGGVGVNAVEDYLQTDASINPGNSGGPLVDLDGRVLGINTMIVSRGQGIGLAVPAVMARRVAELLLKTGRVDRTWIGVGLQDLTPELAAAIPSAPPLGALINTVSPSGPASKANLNPGDVVTSILGKPVRDAQDLIREIFLHDAGEAVTLDVNRGGKRYQTKVILESRNEPPPPVLPVQRTASQQPGLGLTVRDAADPRSPPGTKATVVRVNGVATDSPADRAGVKPGDILLEVDGKQQPTAADVEAATRDGRLLLRIQRPNAVLYTAVHR